MHFELHYWLSEQLRTERNEAMLKLFHDIAYSRQGGPRTFFVFGSAIPRLGTLTDEPDWTIHVENDVAIVRSYPFGQAWRLSVDELVAMSLQWFDACATAFAEELRHALRATTKAALPRTAGSVIALLMGISVPSVSAISNVLDSPLAFVRASEPIEEYESVYSNGPISFATLRLNAQRQSATLILHPRVSSVRYIAADELGVTASFDGFNFERPEGARAQYRVNVGSTEVHFVDPARNEGPPIVSIGWANVQRAAPLPKCSTPPTRIAQLNDIALLKTPSRHWLDMRFDGEQWIATAALKLKPNAAMHIELTNLAEFPGTREHRNDTLRFSLEFFARESRLLAGSTIARETLHARIISACVANTP